MDVLATLTRPEWIDSATRTLSVTLTPCGDESGTGCSRDVFTACPELTTAGVCDLQAVDPVTMLAVCRGEPVILAPLLERAIHCLSRHSDVIWIDLRFPAKVHLRWVKQLVYTPLPEAIHAAVPPQLTFQLNGEGEIVGCADTGIGTDHSFFFDPNYPLPPYNTVNPKHRKVVTYVTVNADNGDAPGGHGTFCVSEVRPSSPRASLVGR